jgi:prepilin-type N-terminal cleavage/methylation domain-containing protein
MLRTVVSYASDERETMSDERQSRAHSRTAPRLSSSAHRSPSAAASSSFIIHHSSFPCGFTLIELMVTILIISILAGLFLGALSRAQTQANIAHTQSLIAKLNSQLMLRYESYRTRRLPIDTTTWDPWLTVNGSPLPPVPPGALNVQQDEELASMQPRHAAAHRLAAIRELMRMELPDRWTDVTDFPVVYHYAPEALSFLVNSQRQVIPQTATNQSYRRRLTSNYSIQYEDAECLYLIVTGGLADNTMAGEQISPNDIGDADGDGMLEFHDAWGNPIHFLRWAPGFGGTLPGSSTVIPSDLQPYDPNNVYTDNSGTPHPDPRFVVSRHDQFDPLKLQATPQRNLSASPPYFEEGFALYPLIYSAGPDGITDLCRQSTDASGNPQSPLFSYSGTNPSYNGQPNFFVGDKSTLTGTYSLPPNAFPYNPYQLVVSRGAQTQFGAGEDDNGDGDNTGWTDNITNHLIGQ